MNKPSSHFMRRLFHSRWFYIVNVLLICLVSFSFAREIVHSRDIAKQIQSLQKQSEALQTQHLAIADLKNAMQTESFVEREARLKLGLKKPGESLVIVKNEKKTDSTQTDPDSDHPLTPSLLKRGDSDPGKSLANSSKWWYYFFNKQAYRDAKSL